MARFNASLCRTSVEITPYVAAVPYVEIDEDSIRYTATIFQGYGVVDMDGELEDVEFIYYGKFNYSDEQSFLASRLTGFNMAGSSFGAFPGQGFNLRVSDFLVDPSKAAAKMLSGNDTIIGSDYADKIDAYLGNDFIYAGKGNDHIIGGAGTNQLWGQAGKDTFYLSKGVGHSVVKDFRKGQDKISFLAGTSGLRISSKGLDAYIYQNNDLMAIVAGASGQLKMNGSSLV